MKQDKKRKGPSGTAMRDAALVAAGVTFGVCILPGLLFPARYTVKISLTLVAVFAAAFLGGLWIRWRREERRNGA